MGSAVGRDVFSGETDSHTHTHTHTVHRLLNVTCIALMELQLQKDKKYKQISKTFTRFSTISINRICENCGEKMTHPLFSFFSENKIETKAKIKITLRHL